jgi:hypothetical protein
MMVSEWQKMIVGRWTYKRTLEKELCIILWIYRGRRLIVSEREDPISDPPYILQN